MLSAAFGALTQRLLRAEVLDFSCFGIFVITKVKLQLVVFSFVVKLDDHLGSERPARLGAKAFEWADFFVAQKLLDFSCFKRPASRCFAKRKAATTIAVRPCFAGAGVAAVVFFHHATAVGARRRKRCVVARNGVLVVTFGFGHHAFGHGGNFSHEGLAAQSAFFHLRQLELPVARQFCF